MSDAVDAMAWKLDRLHAEGHGREAVRLAFGPPRPPVRARVVSNAVLVAGLVLAGNPTLRVSVEGWAELVRARHQVEPDLIRRPRPRPSPGCYRR